MQSHGHLPKNTNQFTAICRALWCTTCSKRGLRGLRAETSHLSPLERDSKPDKENKLWGPDYNLITCDENTCL